MLQISTLVLEVTRKCNLRCVHCLRGNPQRVTMTPEILNQTLSHVEEISSITFTGGEPSLASEVIDQFVDICLWNKIRYNSFYIVTNGKTRNGFQKFMAAVDRLYSYADEPGVCCLTLSRDQYHRWVAHEINLNKFTQAPDPDEGYYEPERPYLSLGSRIHNIDRPLAEGRAIETQVGISAPEQQGPWVIDEEDNGRITFPDGDNDIVYVAANGNVVSNCNMSFRRMDHESKGNVLTQSLPDIIRGYSKPYVEQERKIAV